MYKCDMFPPYNQLVSGIKILKFCIDLYCCMKLRTNLQFKLLFCEFKIFLGR